MAEASSSDVEAKEVDLEGVDDDGDVVIGQEITCSKCTEKSLLGATSVLWCNECGKAVHTSCLSGKTSPSNSPQSCPACGKVSLSSVRGGDQQIGTRRSSSSSHSSKSSTPLAETSGQKEPAGPTEESLEENCSPDLCATENRLPTTDSATGTGEKMTEAVQDNDKTVIVSPSCTSQSSAIPTEDPTPMVEEDLTPPTSVNLSCENSMKPATRNDETLPLRKQSSTSSSPSSWPTEKELLAIESSSDEDEDEDYTNLSHDTVGSESSDLAEELVIKSNSEYLIQRCRSIMKSVQGVMLTSTSRHASRQIQAVIEHPGLNPMLRTSNRNSTSSYHEIIPPFQRLTKQSLAEVQYAAKLMTNIVRHSMGSSLDPNDDSATEESDTDDDEVVLPDDRIGQVSSLEYNPYLPVENNPFIDAIKVEKEYEIRRTSLDFSINECDYSLTKSLALRKHCKARKPCFQLEKPPASTNVINIPVDATSSNGIVSGDELIKETCNRSSSNSTACLDVSRVSDMMPRRPSQDEAPRTSSNNNNGNICEISPGVISISAKLETASLSSSSEPMQTDQDSQKSSTSGATTPRSSSQPGASQESDVGDVGSESNERHTYFPSIKALGLDGPSVLGVELINCSDPGQSSSRCAAIKRPDKNRKVFQLGGIQNIFRDPARLPTVFCNCYGRDELCALCLGRAKKKAEVNHVFMTDKDKLAILDETYHKTLSFPEDVPLEVLLTSSAMGGSVSQNTNPFVTNIQKLIKSRSRKFPPEFLETGPRPKKPRSYDIKPYVESPERSPNKKDGRSSEEAAQSPRKRPARKSQSSFDDKDHHDYAGKGYSRERKDSIRRTRNQEFDIDNIVIPYSMAATTRVEQLVYKPIETPRWRVLEYCEIFTAHKDDKDFGELEDLSNAAFIHRHNKCEVEEKNRFSTALQKAINSTRKTRRVDSIGGSESIGDVSIPDETSSSSQLQSLEKTNKDTPSVDKAAVGPNTPQVTDNSTVITEAMANQALKSLFKVGRRRTISTSMKVEEEDETPELFVDPWPQRKFPLPEIEYKDMVEVMHKCYPDCPVGMTSHSSSHSAGPASPSYLF